MEDGREFYELCERGAGKVSIHSAIDRKGGRAKASFVLGENLVENDKFVKKEKQVFSCFLMWYNNFYSQF